jgi:hypothetical protein
MHSMTRGAPVRSNSAFFDGLSPELKALYAAPGPPPEGVPELASSDELDDWQKCGGDPETLLEEAAGN